MYIYLYEAVAIQVRLLSGGCAQPVDSLDFKDAWITA